MLILGNYNLTKKGFKAYISLIPLPFKLKKFKNKFFVRRTANSKVSLGFLIYLSIRYHRLSLIYKDPSALL